jgi:hypothetical protein
MFKAILGYFSNPEEVTAFVDQLPQRLQYRVSGLLVFHEIHTANMEPDCLLTHRTGSL